MSKFRKEFIELVNKFRKDPTFIIPDIEEQMGYVDDKKVLRIPGSNCGIQLNDGKKAYQDAINEIKTLKTAPELKTSAGLNAVAKDYLKQVCAVDDPDDVPSDAFNDTLNKYGKFVGSLSNISEFGGDSPKQTFINLLVQDGSAAKNNCKSFAKDRYKEIGVHFNEHPTYSFATFVLMATKFTSNSNVPSEEEEPVTMKPKETVLLQEKVVSNSPGNDRPAATSSAPAAGGDDEELTVVKTETKQKMIKRDGKKIKLTTTIETYSDGSTCENTKEEVIG
ncbi:MAG: hypothetical protein MJ252_09770 [archaeon]|nr:hypothetical protein [archaeon]